MRRHRVRTPTPWEDRYGFARLVRVGRHIHVSGTTAMLNDVLVGEGDAYTQAQQCLRNIAAALSQVEAGLSDVVRTRMYVVDIARDADAVGRAHCEQLGEVMPATSMVEVRALIDPRMLVEIEAEAIVGAGLRLSGERPRIEEADFSADSDLAEMLRSVSLPMPGKDERVRMLSAYVGGDLVGCVGYEQYADGGVLHSLVVIREAKGEGVGGALVNEVIARLRRAGVRDVYLATTDATRYFAYLGFSPVEQAEIPATVLASAVLGQYGTGEAVFMRRMIAKAG